ncbi:MAG: TauD/TfdA family dioxygenase [Pseudomonadota bacterium]
MTTPQNSTRIHVTPVAGALGAQIQGVDLTAPMSDALFDQIRRAFLDHLVIFLPGQQLTPSQLVEFSRRFGEPVQTKFEPPLTSPPVDGFPEIYQLIKEPDSTDANIGGFWHADVTYREYPNLAAVAYALEAPTYGGDTLYSNLYLAYDALSSGMKKMLATLQAVHSSTMPHSHGLRSASVSRTRSPEPGDMTMEVTNLEKSLVETVHPVVRCHPETGRKSLYVNRGFTSHFVGMTVEESLPLLRFLWEHMELPEFTCRYGLATGTVVVWDNRCTLHYALNDYHGQRRVLHRVSIAEKDRPAK